VGFGLRRQGGEIKTRREHGKVAGGDQREIERLERLTANRFALRVRSATGGIVVSSVTFDRGWQLRIDGERPAPLRVNAAFLGFALAAGEHRADLRYHPAGWTWGLRLCGLALVASLLAALRGVRRGRRAVHGADA
jgi:uncharacterized membrane protein YfhO